MFVCTVSEYYVHVQQLTVKPLICLLYSQSLIWMKEKKEENFYSGQMHVFLTYKVYNQPRTDGKEFNLFNTLPPMQHHSFFRNVSPLLITSWVNVGSGEG